jgi:hypothetical protein
MRSVTFPHHSSATKAAAPAAGNGVNAAAMLRQVVAKMQAQSKAEAERLRAAIRSAAAVLEAAVGD